MTQLMIGADPELFCKNRFTKEFISAHDLVPGTKENPAEIPFGAMQADGTAAEFNISPADNKEDFIFSIAEATRTMGRVIHLKNPDANLTVEPVAFYDKKYFDSLPESAKELGCDPDYNAWTMEMNPAPEPKGPVRTAGGHVHIGWQEPSKKPLTQDHMHSCQSLVKQLDAVLYPMSFFWDEDKQRRSQYGQMGAFRPKPYGVEYRVLSNAWVSDPDICGWVFDACVASDAALVENSMLYEHPQFTWFRSKKKINRNDLIKYHSFLVDHGMPPLPKEYL